MQDKIICKKTVVGLDVSKDSFTACIGIFSLDFNHNITKPCKFSNDINGYKGLLSWIRKSFKGNKFIMTDECQFVMEATGVYYERLAYFLDKKKMFVSVQLPNKIKSYSRTLETKSKTDDIDAKTITRFGLSSQINKWQAPSEALRKLREFEREYHNYNQAATKIKNQIHAKEYSYAASKETLKRLRASLKHYQSMEKQVLADMKELVDNDADLNQKIKKIMTIKGVGFLTVVSIIAETNGFALINNKKQLTSYAGLDVVQRQSGMFKGKTRISKKGNSFIRTIMYMPALSACKSNPSFKNTYGKLCERKVYKKIGIIAVARKLLCLIYTLWKNNTEYIENYENVKYAS